MIRAWHNPPQQRQFKSFFTTHWRWLVLLLYGALGLIALWQHAMWRDELNVWAIARDSDSLTGLFSAIRYEGHPGLWYLLLYGVNQFTDHPFGMQLIHWLIGLGIGYLWLNHAPFEPIQKAVFLFGYFPFFEYYLLSRNYSLGILTLVAVCTVFAQRRRSYTAIALLLALGANTSAYCLFLTGAIALTLIVEYCFPKLFAFYTQASRSNALSSLGLYSFGVILSFAQLIPPADSYLHGGTSLGLGFNLHRFLEVLSKVGSSYILVIQPSDRLLDLAIFSLLSLAILIVFGWQLRNRPIVLFLYAIGNLEILGFAYIKFAGGLRHYGHLYILLIICLWLLQSETQRLPTKKRRDSASTDLSVRLLFGFFNLLLGLQFVMGIINFTNDFITPYSASKSTAQFIQDQDLAQNLIVGSPDMVMTPLSGYLNQSIYYPETQAQGSYVLFKQGRQDVDQTEVLRQVETLIRDQSPILLILNQEITVESNQLELEFLQYFPDGVIHDEEYYLYQVRSLTSTEQRNTVPRSEFVGSTS